MYGPDEHREALRRVDAIAAKIAGDREWVESTRGYLLEDEPARTQNARESLRAASLLLERAAKACDEARAALPTPAARPDSPAAYDALHEGHR